ncbi:MAG: hypothetical protein AB7C90_10955 [Bacteroidales bacterium]
MRIVVFLGLLLMMGAALVSCQKDSSNPQPVNPVDTDDIMAPASFNWSMIHEVTVRISGLDSPVSVSGVLKVSDTSGVVYYQKWVSIAADQNFTVAVPSSLTQLVISLGTLSKTVPVVNGVVTTDYHADMPPLAPEV